MNISIRLKQRFIYVVSSNSMRVRHQNIHSNDHASSIVIISSRSQTSDRTTPSRGEKFYFSKYEDFFGFAVDSFTGIFWLLYGFDICAAEPVLGISIAA